jgi:hypothetical protein
VGHVFQGWAFIPLFAVAMPLNSTGMYRGIIREDGVPKTAIFADDVLE